MDRGGSGRPTAGIKVHRPRTRAGGGGPSARAGPGLVGHARPLPAASGVVGRIFPGDAQRLAVGDESPLHQPRPL